MDNFRNFGPIVFVISAVDRDDEQVLFRHPVFLEESLYSRAITPNKTKNLFQVKGKQQGRSV